MRTKETNQLIRVLIQEVIGLHKKISAMEKKIKKKKNKK